MTVASRFEFCFLESFLLLWLVGHDDETNRLECDDGVLHDRHRDGVGSLG